MRTKIVVFAGAAAIALLTAGCTDKPAPATAPSAPAPVATSAAPAPVESASTPAAAPTTVKPVATPVKTAKPAPEIDGDDWIPALEPCRSKEQKVEVEKIVTGDLTGDGVDDVVVSRSCTAITSYYPSTVEIFDGAAGSRHPKRIASLLGGDLDMPSVRSVRLSGRTLTITAHGVGKKAPTACPNLKLTYDYKYSGGKVTLTNRKAVTVTSGDCLPVNR
ncbi:hypothetical protein [Actinoplanes regularis]|uniref:hypothetical protein n=1 Tax=Actinoplanes regularis TaxID=52697 RepID=UPI0025529545|nr:hypothetical protein [Actinoplanes regularis]GLW31588.1 hypothetical protein Areg01_45280 [Actinoplanes regularis]